MITISLCMIVKDEEAVLPRILSQMKPVADEIIIVDTGSSDNTKAIARQFTDLVFDYPWNEDFSAARNFANSKASMDYWMWLDADDYIAESDQNLLIELKNSLDSSTDVVMMKYVTGFDDQNNPAFLYYRERLMKNNKTFVWNGKVHEAVTPSGAIVYLPIEIQHRKIKPSDSDRNLRIYETALKNGETLEPRHQFYYGRELFFHQRYEAAIDIFKHFLTEPAGWIENQIDACLQLSHCFERLGKNKESLLSLFYSFTLDIPRAEVCCEIGRLMVKGDSLPQAIFWYQQALFCKADDISGAFIQKDCYDYLPYIQLCVCYDRLGQHEKALEYHKLSKKVKPDSEAVKLNEKYFAKLNQNNRIEHKDIESCWLIP